MAILSDYNVRLIPFEIENIVDKKFLNAFLILYFSQTDSFVFTRVKEVEGQDIICEHNQIKRILRGKNIVGAYDLRKTYECLGKDGLEFLSRHEKITMGDLQQIAYILKTDDPLLMLKFEEQASIDTYVVSKDGTWTKLRRFKF